MSLFSKSESYIGVDIGAHGMKMVELKKTKGRPQLWTYGMADEILDIHIKEKKKEKEKTELHPPGLQENKNNKNNLESGMFTGEADPRVEKYGGMLKDLWKKAKASTNRATASLPVSQVFHALINLPEVDEKELDHHVKAKVKKMLPRPIEQMQVVHQVIPPPEGVKTKNKTLLVTAAPKALINFYTSIFQKAGLQLVDLETEAFALERSLVGKDKATSMIVDIGAERTNFFIIDRGLPITHRSIQSGGDLIDELLKEKLGLDEKQISQVKVDISKMSSAELEDIKSVFESVVQPIIKEIEYSFNLFLGQLGNENKKPEKIILTGGSCVFPFFVSEISENFPMKVYIGDPWARVVYQQRLKQLLDTIGPRMSVAIGLAMRNII
ncbi:MAG: hypothetical protein GF349_02915 [Candidatus Magasanikbacteria bacterium]|nr:hypothetical protein [Candidatus Magasanikbacteria bacterium]